MYKKKYANKKLYQMTLFFFRVSTNCVIYRIPNIWRTLCLPSCAVLFPRPQIHVRMSSAMQLVFVERFSDRSVTHCNSVIVCQSTNYSFLTKKNTYRDLISQSVSHVKSMILIRFGDAVRIFYLQKLVFCALYNCSYFFKKILYWLSRYMLYKSFISSSISVERYSLDT